MEGLLSTKKKTGYPKNPHPYGMPIDPDRPMVPNTTPGIKGTHMTEQSITIQADIGDGELWYNIPTVIKGEKVSDDSAYAFFVHGMNPHVGVYGSSEEAIESSVLRSKMINKLRQPGLLK